MESTESQRIIKTFKSKVPEFSLLGVQFESEVCTSTCLEGGKSDGVVIGGLRNYPSNSCGEMAADSTWRAPHMTVSVEEFRALLEAMTELDKWLVSKGA